MTATSIEGKICLRPVQPQDLPAIGELHRRSFGPGRFAVSAYRIREGTLPISPFCKVAELDGKIIGAVRMTPVEIGGTRGALLLGPIAVEPGYTNQGLGATLIKAGLACSDDDKGPELVILVGNLSYYGRFGFAPVPPGQITFPGPVDPARILACERKPGALARFRGEIRADRTAHPLN